MNQLHQRMSILDIYRDWQDGTTPDQEALESLVWHLSVLEDNIEPLEATRKVLRGYISEVVERQPNSAVELVGYGKLAIRSASVTKSYDSKALDALVMRLIQEGQTELAQAVALCKKESSRVGGLVITKDREKNV
jgi:hypothetical protein